MIPELGHLALIIALCLAVVQSVFPIAGAAGGRDAWMALAKPAARAQCAFLTLAFSALVYSFVVSDFSVAYVAQNSNTALPTAYRVSAVWGGHEGSLLLWALILSVWTFAVSVFSRNLPLEFTARVLGVMGLVSVGFLLFMLFTSNPFTRLPIAPVQGRDLNPLLQDIGLILHPPMLYMGYVGFSVAFGFAVAALLGGQLDSAWAKWSRPWTTIAWVFLTIGIALGSWWAYYELGWGGWWFWDPVENASFMPWLAGTALIHSLAATEKRGAFKSWTLLLAISAFSLSLLGTFIVRSGVLTSVHAFASDPTRGVFILAYLAVVIGGSLTLYAWRAPRQSASVGFKPFSRETWLLVNNLILVVAVASVLLGTMYPLFVDALGGGKLSVGPPYFNAVFVPLMILLAISMIFGALSRWREDTLTRLIPQLRFAFGGAVLFALAMVAMSPNASGIKLALGLALAGWIVVGMIVAFYTRLGNSSNKLVQALHLPRSFYGMTVAHIGFAVIISGITLSSNLSTEAFERMSPGEDIKLGPYTFTFDGVKQVEGPNYVAEEGLVAVTKNDKLITTLKPQKRTYQVQTSPMTEAGIDGGFTRDLYVSLGEPLGNQGDWSLRIYHKPFVRWIWLGAILMALGGLLAVSDRRYRSARAKSAVNEKIAPVQGAEGLA